MATITGPTVAAPAYITPVYRYGTDDWSGSNALEYQVWQTPPVPAQYAADGVTVLVPAVPGVPYDLTGCTISGMIRYRPAVVELFPNRVVPPFPPLVGVIGSIVGPSTQGVAALSVPRSVTGTVSPQDISAWGAPGAPCLYPCQSVLIARPMVTDPSGNLVSIGDQPLFVF